MHTYFDTSAIVPLVVAEPSTALCSSVWNRSMVVVTSALAYVEAHAALAAAHRHSRLSSVAYSEAVEIFETIWQQVISIPVQAEIINQAATFASAHELRGYDAVHAATAATVVSADFAAISGDRELLRGLSELGIHTIDTAG